MTHTYATMEVSRATYDEVRARLLAAGYAHAINDEGELDMHGIALTPEPPAPALPPTGAA